ncbi:ATP-binding cassette sub-family A member 17-like [Teleopsis dalmanni]|uniref:ATP-binding cassette sub-family A member 17-like n=1 Tax=Teleopsis dalmanni TaxID=139649 RepID=UPI0018CDE43C|nr:ATP-binding cassette sub-family A member 17-like [Teleopsis dalmanni]
MFCLSFIRRGVRFKPGAAAQIVAERSFREAGGSNKEIIVTNSPQKYEIESLVQYYKTRVSQPILVLIVMVFVCLISISSVSFVTYERTTYAKLIQFINGLHFWIYWVSHLIWQLIFFLFIPIVVVAVVICIFSTKSDYFSDMADLFVIIICVAIYMLPFLYFCTFHIQEQHMVPALIIAAFIMGILDMYFTTFRNHLSFILSIVPFYAVLSAIEDYHVHKKVQEACTNITIENCNGTTNCCYSKYSWGTSGRLDELAFMLFFGVFFFNWVVLTDSGFMNEVLHWVRDVHSEYNINKVAPDESVEDEITRVDNMTDADMQQQTIVVNHVTKVEQDQKFVVNDVTFAIEKEESFGVVGLYGSGKNALLNVIAGVTPPTVGVVRINNKNMNAFFIKEIYSDIDYLARKNALFEEFTGYQNLKLHFLINGIENINDVCEILLGSFYLTDVASTKVKHYTTMNKYMLRMAVGCIRRKSIVLMDNPISNTDPPTTIMLWRLINIMRSTGMTILLTTNSMTDCNMCCTRFAILSGGEMKFIGTKEELLERSEDGYILEIIINNDRSSDVSIISSEESIKKVELNDFMQSRFQNPKLILICFPRFKFFIPRRNKLWKTFKLMEKHKTELSIVSYFVTEKDFQTILVEFSR